jgi:hypothetical protein
MLAVEPVFSSSRLPVFYRPNIPGGIPMRPPPAAFFIIFCMSRNCSSRRLISLIGRPHPLAMRARREPLIRFRRLALFLGHREDDRLDMLQALGVQVGVLEHLAVHAGEHLQDVLHRSQLLHLLHGREEVLEVESFLADLLLQLLGFGGVERFLRLFHERHDVAHLEDAPGHALGVELLERVGLLADADVLDRLLEDAVDRQGGATAGIAVHLGEDHAGDA